MAGFFWYLPPVTCADNDYLCTIMKKSIFIFSLLILFSLISLELSAQCSICTKTAMQLGTKPASGLNSGIIYLMAIPYLAVGIISYKWWKSRSSK